MSQLFSGPPKPPALPKPPKPDNPQVDAQQKANQQRQGAAASILTSNKSGGASLFGSTN